MTDRYTLSNAVRNAKLNDAAPGEVKSARRTIEVLQYLAEAGGARSLGAIQQSLGYPKSSLYMLLQTLVAAGWLETDATGTLYSLGVRALLVGTAYIDASGVVSAARPTLEWLRDRTTETVHLARIDGAEVVYLSTHESKHYLRPFSRVGRCQPVNTTSLGKSLLAERTDDEVLTLLPARLVTQTPNSISSRQALLQELATTRRRGYAVDREENTIGLNCFGVALHDSDPPIHAISCSVPVARLDSGREREIVAAMLEGRAAIDRLVRRGVRA